LVEERAEHDRLARMRKEMELARDRGELISKKLVMRQLSYLMVAIRQKILVLPSGWTRKLTGISDSRKMKAQLEAMACQLLEDLRELPSKVTDPNWEVPPVRLGSRGALLL
jgi:hypothetical protein